MEELNWKLIKRKYAKAFKQLQKDHETVEAWGEIDSPSIWGIFVDEEHWAMRHLYDFFDKRKLNMWVITGDGKKWSWFILKKDRLLLGAYNKKKYSSRQEAEMAGWMKCFEQLELAFSSSKE